MAYGVFDRQDSNEMISGAFTSEAAAEAFMDSYVGDDGYEYLFVDRICDKHGIYGGDQPVTECDCWNEGPYEDARDIHTGYGRRY